MDGGVTGKCTERERERELKREEMATIDEDCYVYYYIIGKPVGDGKGTLAFPEEIGLLFEWRKIVFGLSKETKDV